MKFLKALWNEHYLTSLSLFFFSFLLFWTQCFLNAVVQCLSHTCGLRGYCLLKSYKHEKFSKEEAKLMEGAFPLLSVLSWLCLFSCVRFSCFLLVSVFLPMPAFSKVLSGLWDVNEGDKVVNPRQFYNVFTEAVPYFSGYRWGYGFFFVGVAFCFAFPQG